MTTGSERQVKKGHHFQGDREEALRFLRAVFDGNPPGYLTLSSWQRERDQWNTWWGV
jgi:hypothetical protein